MPPRFLASSFKFEKEQVPDHLEEHPSEPGRDTSKYWLEAEDGIDHGHYPLATDIDDLPTARVLQAARLRFLAEDQAGGPDPFGILDTVNIRVPEQSQ